MAQPRPSAPATLRGVYEEPYRINGHRVFFSIDSRGEQGRLRTVAPGWDESDVIAELWADLNATDPLPPVLALRLIRGGLDEAPLEK